MKKVLITTLETFFLITLFFFTISALFIDWGEQQFSFLAQSFLHGSLDISQFPTALNDAVFFAGKYYWPLGPFPALILTPFVFIFNFLNSFFYQKYLQIPLIFGIIYLIYVISKKIGYKAKDALYLAASFVFASPFLAIILYSWSWQFAIVVSVFLIFLAIYEHFTKKRYVIIGIIYACLLLTRVTASFGIVFFILDVIFSKSTSKQKVLSLVKLLTPLFIALVLLFIYNYTRFGNIFEQGYSYQILRGGVLKAREYGLFSLIHVPGNLYYFLLATPAPVLLDGVSRVLKFPYIAYDPWGMSIFFTSPYFLYLFFMKYRDLTSKFLWITVVAIALPIFLYYGVGPRQFGYRYSLDFLPFIFLILIKNYKIQKGNLHPGFKLLIIVAYLFDLYLLMTHV
ncbi:hypothetical protein A3A76_04060 [Candidatus Woesebacteria bacterium RIFCSPLOWO2_01_FULL_39_23]|uniref:Glycosyltransferase RgtA/B/C/D-like domain-containing protein n=1 Tax=Candidatus Woesebacteria bacterium RIFCSPHIGHO2_01_FULL_40_22 TaxID=1802499 RepID=A0A1F7YGF2_9BACT|nr:MAG: hypothetical protein A2141_03555 [Candidatus Woesebacteria bacterium RBG_16_40_11]OGM26407.1 MAG: hypothetical protein A2628_00060 [Candidatus Woesebacteria bacterium RIFCSPHIGHO2_01_FULL_40_22]OGM36039.1 MAG: hypothetical protein A3E41_00395 [Candidatus Woesebacteria bacterium RIFCSPHIGHO2_12_FULL_38_9]OGM61990.1 MAG: hypothetical protein A3A76_04060 [Candidatus Woesebacteria bacterium RIFCSPLOWO2_01_FULL_39_23]